MVAAGQVLGPQSCAHRGVVSRNRDWPALLSGERGSVQRFWRLTLSEHTQNTAACLAEVGNPGHGCRSPRGHKPSCARLFVSVRVAEVGVTRSGAPRLRPPGFILLLKLHSTSLFPRATLFMKHPVGGGLKSAHSGVMSPFVSSGPCILSGDPFSRTGLVKMSLA